MSANARRLVVRGSVQGVGYRAHVQTAADRLGIAGWVRNRRDGSVEMVARGDTQSFEAFRDACRKGPPGSYVASVDESDVEGDSVQMPEDSNRFSVQPTV